MFLNIAVVTHEQVFEMCVPNKHVAMRVWRYLPHKEYVGATCSVELATCIDLHSAGRINPHTAMHTCMAHHYSIFLFNFHHRYVYV